MVGPRLVGIDVAFLQERFDTSDDEGWNGDNFDFDASLSVGGFVAWEWDFGDGTPASGESSSSIRTDSASQRAEWVMRHHPCRFL